MSKRISLLAAALLIFSVVPFVAAQQTTTTTVTPTTVTETVQHPDGTYTVIEYPVGKETIVNLDPVTITGGKGQATILRDDKGTLIKLNLTGVPSDVTALNLYAVDPAGMVTSLGPVTVTNGTGIFSATTPLNRFMLIASPEGTLTTYDPNTKIFFRSAVPSGFAVIPHTMTPVAVTPVITTTPIAVTPVTSTTPVAVTTTAPVAVTTTTTPVAVTPVTTTAPVAVTTTTTPVTGVTQTVNSDGTFSVVEWPTGREINVDLTPVALAGGKGVATILRDDNGTRIKLNLSGVPTDVTALNLYAVDPTGAVTSLGPVTVTNGMGTFTTTTPLNKFMLIGSPEGTLTTYDPNTKVFFRNAVPEGLAVIPHTTVPVGEQVAATAAPTNPYTVPMLNIPAYKKGDDTKIKVNFSGALAGARANVFITPKKGGAAKVKMRFHELKDAPAGKVFTVWAISPDNTFVKLGQVVNTGGKNEAQIESEVPLPDFGLLVTMEDATGTLLNPAGPAIGIVEIVR